MKLLNKTTAFFYNNLVQISFFISVLFLFLLSMNLINYNYAQKFKDVEIIVNQLTDQIYMIT